MSFVYYVLLFLITSLLFLFSILLYKKRKWKVVRGEILTSKYEVTSMPMSLGKLDKNVVEYKVIIEYQYEIDHLNYLSSQIIPQGQFITYRKSIVDNLLNRFSVGTNINVYYSSNNLKKSALIIGHELPSYRSILLVLIVSLFVGLVFAVLKFIL